MKCSIGGMSEVDALAVAAALDRGEVEVVTLGGSGNDHYLELEVPTKMREVNVTLELATTLEDYQVESWILDLCWEIDARLKSEDERFQPFRFSLDGGPQTLVWPSSDNVASPSAFAKEPEAA